MKERCVEAFGKLSVMMAVLLGTMQLVIYGRWIYQMSIKTEHLTNAVPLSEPEILKNYDVLMAYMRNPFAKTLHLPDFHSSKEGLQHFAEVKTLFQLSMLLFILFFVIGILFLRKLAKEKTYWKLIRPIQYTLIGIVLFLFLLVSNFEEVFVKFHEIFFRNDYWMYDPSKDPVIQILPENFFFICFAIYFGILFVIGIISLCHLKRGSQFEKQ
ncbi:MAG: TIGR01906 family membrane protein [Streptococcaceae bacterium]|jgi:integral membrane protein (TIGR01906 family)|nr:TIGR01906 family membrane protein [Streptococcaceae bacterium]